MTDRLKEIEASFEVYGDIEGDDALYLLREVRRLARERDEALADGQRLVGQVLYWKNRAHTKAPELTEAIRQTTGTGEPEAVSSEHPHADQEEAYRRTGGVSLAVEPTCPHDCACEDHR